MSTAEWKLRLNILAGRDLAKINSTENAELAKQSNINVVRNIDPSLLDEMIFRYGIHNVATFKKMAPYKQSTLSHDTNKFIYELIENEIHYSDTTLFKQMRCGVFVKRKLIFDGKTRLYQLDSEELFIEYEKKCRRQADYIQEHGLTLTADRGEMNIGVVIDEFGKILFYRWGHHRLAIARSLRIPTVPVQIAMIAGSLLNRADRNIWKRGAVCAAISDAADRSFQKACQMHKES